MNSLKLLALAIPALALACGSRAVDLEGERIPKVTASSDPGIVALIDEAVTSLGVDDERLYWKGTSYVDYTALRSCKKASCANSLVTYDPRRVSVSADFFVFGGEVFWLESADYHHATLRACNVAGCDHGSRTVSSFVIEDADLMTFGADAAFVSAVSYRDYGVNIASSSIYRFSLGPGDNPPTLVAQLDGAAASLAVQDDYVYWLERTPRVGALTPEYFNKQRLQRARTDGSGQPELLAQNLEILYSNSHSLVVDRDDVYWSESALYGSIHRCPLAGCADPSTAEVFLQPIRTPTTLWLDAGNLYWAYDTAGAGYGMSTCRLTSCTPIAAVAPGLGDIAATMFDDEFIYTAATAQETTAGDGSVTLPLRRIARVVP